MEIELKRLHQVLTVVRSGTISKAAEELHMTQPALSRSISILEERYGFRIFDRGRGGAVLTAVGKSVVKEAEALLRHARSADHNFKLFQSGDAGKVAFGMGPLIASLILPSMSARFLRERPQLQLVSVIRSAETLYQEMMDDQIELLLCGAHQLAGKDGLSAQPAGRIKLANIVRFGHPLTQRDRLCLSDLADYPTVIGAETHRPPPHGRHGAFVCDNYHIVRETTLNSDAVWVSSPSLVKADIDNGLMQVLNVEDDPLQTTAEVYAYSRKEDQLSPGAQAIVDYAVEFLAEL